VLCVNAHRQITDSVATSKTYSLTDFRTEQGELNSKLTCVAVKETRTLKHTESEVPIQYPSLSLIF